MKQRVEVGILFSRSGGYGMIAEACRTGVLAAIDEINANPDGALEFIPVERNPQGNVDRYAPLCAEILRNSQARHIIGCVTSWSRKEVIPVLEKTGGMLWYPCPYEGFEANDRVIYTHACPNQHLVPLLGWVVPRHGANGFLLGSNYIWGWETNRVARDLIADASGKVLGERYLPLGETDVSRLIEEIRATRPSFVLNNLIGPSSYAFLRAYAQLGREDGHFRPERCPILSCNLSEAELPILAGAADGHLSVGPYFRDDKEHSGLELAGITAAPRRCASSFEAAAYAAVSILAETLIGGNDVAAGGLAAAFAAKRFDTPLGRIAIDPQTQHASLPVIIGRVNGLTIDPLETLAQVEPDPYLSRYNRTAVFGRPALRVVS